MFYLINLEKHSLIYTTRWFAFNSLSNCNIYQPAIFLPPSNYHILFLSGTVPLYFQALICNLQTYHIEGVLNGIIFINFLDKIYYYILVPNFVFIVWHFIVLQLFLFKLHYIWPLNWGIFQKTFLLVLYYFKYLEALKTKYYSNIYFLLCLLRS